jgi:hypothetical protein
MSDVEFKNLYRMTRPMFDQFLEEFGEHLPIGRSSNKMSLSPRERLLTFLHFASGAMFIRHSSYSHCMSYGSVVESISKCIEALHQHLVPVYIRLPTSEEAKVEAELFHKDSHCRFPPIIWGAIDGTHVRVI